MFLMGTVHSCFCAGQMWTDVDLCTDQAAKVSKYPPVNLTQHIVTGMLSMIPGNPIQDQLYIQGWNNQ